VTSQVRAVALLSGGLDSTLSALLLKGKGIEIYGLMFVTPFLSKSSVEEFSEKMKHYYKSLGIPIEVRILTDEYFPIVIAPAHGYGKCLNPCIDCRTLFLTLAKRYMEEIDADFLVTGEVVDQRPMSQTLKSIELIERESGMKGMVVRPLSGAFLTPSEPEIKGIVKREWFLDLRGKRRLNQLKLAEKLGLKNFPQPAGGCLLTNCGFSRKVRDLINYNELNAFTAEVVKVGRHFRVDGIKVVVGRNEEEDLYISRNCKGLGYIIEPLTVAGPAGFIMTKGYLNDSLLETTLKIIGRYCDEKHNILFSVFSPTGTIFEVKLKEAFEKHESDAYMV